MRLMALTYEDRNALTENHVALGVQLMQFLDDMGKDADVYFSIDEPDYPEDSEFCYFFAGSDLYLHYTYDGICVELMDEDGVDSEVIKLFPLERTHEATHWLLTQVS